MNTIKVIAEAGINHNGSIKKAFQLVDVAKKSNADFVKFQTYKTSNLVISNAKKRNIKLINPKKISFKC